MKEYPRLSEMGVLHPQHIAQYSVSSIDYVDYLRIVYDRPKGSLLPVTRTYQFPRVQKKLGAGGDAKATDVVMESCPEFLEAIDELKKICTERTSKQDISVQMLDELNRLEEEFALRSARLKALIGEKKVS